MQRLFCALARGSDEAKQGLSCPWQKEGFWFQLCQLVRGMGSLFCPRLLVPCLVCPPSISFAFLSVSGAPAGQLWFAFSLWSCLSSLPVTFDTSCRALLVPLNFLTRTELSLTPPVQPVFPVLMLLFQLVQVFLCAVWWCLGEICACSSYIYRYSCWTSNSSVPFSAYKTWL